MTVIAERELPAFSRRLTFGLAPLERFDVIFVLAVALVIPVETVGSHPGQNVLFEHVLVAEEAHVFWFGCHPLLLEIPNVFDGVWRHVVVGYCGIAPDTLVRVRYMAAVRAGICDNSRIISLHYRPGIGEADACLAEYLAQHAITGPMGVCQRLDLALVGRILLHYESHGWLGYQEVGAPMCKYLIADVHDTSGIVWSRGIQDGEILKQ